jgi:hypothetical protein
MAPEPEADADFSPCTTMSVPPLNSSPSADGAATPPFDEQVSHLKVT